MTLVVDVATQGVRAPLSRERVRDIARLVLRDSRVRDALLSIAFLPARAIASLNRTHLDHTGPTDVIAFSLRGPLGDATRAAVVGDVYIAPDVARRNARLHRVGVREELARLIVHGTLHVLGHQHPDDARRTSSTMWQRQELLLRRARAQGLW
jgi:probable rRNA maturation factor